MHAIVPTPEMPGRMQPASEADPAEWVAEFRRKHGRRPRVLHIGNIAGNAYNNAKLMIPFGFDCHVLCIDYYHIMGCPEWEDADLTGDISDQFAPDWTRVDLGGFTRPRWFVQGPLEPALNYLIAEMGGREREADLLWRVLGVFNKTVIGNRSERFRLRCYAVVKFVRRVLRVLSSSERSRMVIGRIEELGVRWQRQWMDRRALQPPISPLRSVAHRVASLAVAAACPILHGLNRIQRRALTKVERNDAEIDPAELCREFHELFPDRRDPLTPEDIAMYSTSLDLWRQAFSAFDLVVGYATAPIFPMLAGRPYCAFEHGTLRELPFHPDAQGRMTALAYARARCVFVTNSDCLDNARSLAGARALPLPHPFDEDRAVRAVGVDDLRSTLQRELGADVLAFFPTRQDWVEGDGFADKANDRFFQALARLRRDGLRVGVVCCEWGRNVAQSKGLLRALELEDCIKWVAPMGIVRYERHVLACDFVVDQFLLGAFGGVTFRALAAGRPVLTWLCEDEVARSFGTSPPIINCQTTDEIVDALGRVLRDRDELRRIGTAARAWVKQYHSGHATVTTQLRAYARVIDEARQTPGGRSVQEN